MYKSLIFISALLVVAACDSNVRKGIATLGSDFVRAFNQDPKDAPLDASELTLVLTPKAEPFNP